MKRRGAVLAMALVTLLVVGLIAGLMVERYLATHRQGLREVQQLQAEWLAEAAVARGLAMRQADGEYSGETWRVDLLDEPENGEGPARGASGPKFAGVAIIRVEPAEEDGTIIIVAQARYPDHESQRALVERTYTLPLTSAPLPSAAEPTP